MMHDEQTCAVCAAYGRLHCAGCDRTFCVEHVTRHFAMGYFYLCADCTARQRTERAEQAPRRRRKQSI